MLNTHSGMQIHKQRRVLPDDVCQDPQLDQAAHYPNSPVPHQHLARGLILKEEVGNGICDLFLHLLSSANPEGGGSFMCPTCIKTAGSACADVCAVTTTNVWSSWSREVLKRTSYFSLCVLPLPPTLSLSSLSLWLPQGHSSLSHLSIIFFTSLHHSAIWGYAAHKANGILVLFFTSFSWSECDWPLSPARIVAALLVSPIQTLSLLMFYHQSCMYLFLHSCCSVFASSRIKN